MSTLVRPAWRWVLSMLIAGAGSSACRNVEGGRLPRPTIDTLPSGAVRVHSEGPTAWREGEGWRLVEEIRITGDEGTESEVINPSSVTVDAQGRIWLVDQKPAGIKVYERDGRFVRTVGREGEGPGELRVGFLAAAGGFMVLHDPRVTRTSVYDTAGVFVRSWSSQCCYWSEIAVDKAGRIYVPGMWGGKGEPSGTTYYRYTLDGTPVDTLVVPMGEDVRYWTVKSGKGQSEMMMTTSVPFTPEMRYGFDPEGGFVLGWSGDYQLAVSRTGRDTIGLFGRSWTAEPIPDVLRRDTVEAMIKDHDNIDPALLRASFHVEDVPAVRPAFEDLTVAVDGHRWVRVGPWPGGGTRYDVFDPSGAWLGAVQVPVVFSPWRGVTIGADYFVVPIEDEDGRPAIVRYRIEKTSTT